MPIKDASEEYECNLSLRRAPGEDAGPEPKYKHVEYVSIPPERPASAALGVGQHGADTRPVLDVSKMPLTSHIPTVAGMLATSNLTA